jgi:ABC-2 type transport system permease protein
MNLFIAPIRTFELVLAMCIMGISKSIITMAFLGLLAYVLYNFNVLHIGLALIPFFGNLLLFGWALGMVTMAIIQRFGHAAEALIWGVPFLIQPISAVFYPADILPPWLKTIAFMLPSTYVFEGMRSVFNTGRLDISLLLASSLINLVYMFAGGTIFAWTLHVVRKRGLLSRTHIE